MTLGENQFFVIKCDKQYFAGFKKTDNADSLLCPILEDITSAKLFASFLDAKAIYELFKSAIRDFSFNCYSIAVVNVVYDEYEDIGNVMQASAAD